MLVPYASEIVQPIFDFDASKILIATIQQKGPDGRFEGKHDIVRLFGRKSK